VLRCVRVCARAGAEQAKEDFLDTYYGGMYCGLTALTTAVHVEQYMLFYTIAIPIAETLNHLGVPAMFRFFKKKAECVRAYPLH
jgi:hypothetical protein